MPNITHDTTPLSYARECATELRDVKAALAAERANFRRLVYALAPMTAIVGFDENQTAAQVVEQHRQAAVKALESCGLVHRYGTGWGNR